MKANIILSSFIICILGVAITNTIQADGTVIKAYTEEAIYSKDAMNLDNLPQLIYKNDENYILQKEIENNCKYEFEVRDFYKHDSDVINIMKSVWNIEDENYVSVCGINKSLNPEYIVEADKITYFIGLDSGDIILSPFQGGMEAYLIEDNNVIKNYKDVTQNESYKWR